MNINTKLAGSGTPATIVAVTPKLSTTFRPACGVSL